MKFSQLLYLPVWFLRNVVLRKHGPLQTVLFITDYCNLKCKHCFEMGHACTMQKSYEKIKEELEYSYRLGSRFVDFEGGEPTLWRETVNRENNRNLPKEGVDGHTDHNGNPVLNINDLIALAKKIGFFSCTVTTNAQTDFSWVNADLVWMSLDGYKEFHDKVRGEGAFERLDKNAKLFADAQKKRKAMGKKSCSLCCNMAVNNINKTSVPNVLRYVKNSPFIESIAINFHTPYPGTEKLMLDQRTKAAVINQVIAFKKAGYPVQNSVSGLKMMKVRGFKKNCWVSNFILTDGTRLRTCPGQMIKICDDCGFCMAGEMYCVMHLKPDTLLAGMNLRM
ncbi:MAG: radical SAM protein [Parasporobacterium sp.]|nr:radical SAM protein [Parasporobacterium sp.]